MGPTGQSRDAEGKGRNLTWLIIAIIIVIGGGVYLGLYREPVQEVPPGAIKAGEIAANGVAYFGKPARIYGHLTRRVNTEVFLISDAVTGTVDLPIVPKTGVAVPPQISQGDYLIIEGTPTAFDAATIRQDYGIVLPEDVIGGWKGRPVVIAEHIEKIH